MSEILRKEGGELTGAWPEALRRLHEHVLQQPCIPISEHLGAYESENGQAGILSPATVSRTWLGQHKMHIQVGCRNTLDSST